MYKKYLAHQDLLDHYKIEILNNEHIDEVIHLVTKAFCEHEPMTQYLGISNIQFHYFAEIIIKKAALDKLSIVVHNGTNLVACSIVEDIANPIHVDFYQLDTKFKYIFGLLENLCKHFFENKVFRKNNLSHLFITAVDANHHGYGLSKKVNNAAMVLAKNNGFDFMLCEFTNHLNEKGTLQLIKHKKALIGSCRYKNFSMDEIKPFQYLDGYANAYLWELRSGAKLSYYHINQDVDNLLSHSFDEEFQNMRDLFTVESFKV